VIVPARPGGDVVEPPRGDHGGSRSPGARRDDASVTRGQFLSLSTVGLGAMIGGVIGVPATAYILAPVFEKRTFEPVRIGTVDEFPEEGEQFKPVAKTFVEDPSNPNTSAALAWVHNTGNQNTDDWRADDAKFIVFSNRCMHLGCPVVASLLGFGCPCHGGQYNTQGKRTAGPPIRPLDRYEWEIRGSELWVTNVWSTHIDADGRVEYVELKMPGQPVQTPGPDFVPDVLYPNVTYDY
jgi:menaquinol-cytochrome c reductase iron-sulfur subunit